PSFFPAHEYVALRMMVRRSAKRAAVVFTVSEWSKAAIVERFGVPEGRVVVTPNGVDPAFSPEGHRPSGRPYVLFVGALQPRKDPVTAAAALRLLDGEYADLGLVMVGPEGHSAEALRRQVLGGLGSRVSFRGYVGKAELA